VKRGVRKDRHVRELKREKDREAGDEDPTWLRSGAGGRWEQEGCCVGTRGRGKRGEGTPTQTGPFSCLHL
jgi:hypothetical protein